MKIEHFEDLTTVNPIRDDDGNLCQAYQSSYIIDGKVYYTLIKKDDKFPMSVADIRIKIEAAQLEKQGINREEFTEAVYDYFMQREKVGA